MDNDLKIEVKNQVDLGFKIGQSGRVIWDDLYLKPSHKRGLNDQRFLQRDLEARCCFDLCLQCSPV